MRYLFCLCFVLINLSLTASAQESPEPLFTLQQDGLVEVLISPDENYILARSRNEGSTVWDSHTGELVLTFDEETTSAAWSPDSRYIALGDNDAYIKIWNLDGELQHSLLHNGYVLKIIWYRENLLYSRAWYENPDTGSYNGQDAFIWHIEENRQIVFHDSEIIEGVNWQTELSELTATSATIGEDPFVYHAVWLRTDDGRLIDTFKDHSFITGMYWQDGTENPIASFELVHYSGTIFTSELYIFNQNGETLNVLEHDTTIGGVSWNPEQSLLLTWEFINPEVRVWSSNGDLLQEFRLDDSVYQAQWSPDDEFFLIQSSDSNFYVYRTYNFELYRLFPHNNQLVGAIWNQDGSHILAWSGSSFCEENCIYEALLWTRERELLAVFPHETAISEAFWFHNETRILTRSYDSGVKVWDVSSLMD